MTYTFAMRRAMAGLVLGLGVAAGAQWQMQESHTDASLRGIHSLGGGVAWASGSKGTVRRTVDGGKTWEICAVPEGAEKLDFRGVQGVDAKTAVVMSIGKGDSSRLYKTADGCKTWALLFTNPDREGFWDGIQINPKGVGWLFGDPVNGSFVLFTTSDFGKHWLRFHPKGLEADPARAGAFAASNSSLMLRDGAVLFGSGGVDGAFLFHPSEVTICLDNCGPAPMDGRSDRWAKQQLPLGDGTAGSGIFSLGARSDRRTGPLTTVDSLIAVGGDYEKPGESGGTAAFSLDEGEHWSVADAPPHGYRSAVGYEWGHNVWITVGPNGTDVSTDDGKTWRPLMPGAGDAPDADKNWNALSLPFVVGGKGRIGVLREGVVGK